MGYARIVPLFNLFFDNSTFQPFSALLQNSTIDKYASDDKIDLGGGKTDVLDKLVIGKQVFFNV